MTRSGQKIVLVVAIVMGALSATGIGIRLALPAFVASRVAAEVERLGARLPGTVDSGNIRLDGLSSVTLDRITWKDGSDWRLEARDLQATVDPWAVVFGGPKVQKIQIQSLRVRLGDPLAPFPTVGELVSRLKTLASRKAAGSGDAGATVPKVLPDLSVADIRGEIALKGDLRLTLTGGTLDFTRPIDSLDPTARPLSGRLSFRLGDAVPRTLEVSASIAMPFSPQSVKMTLTPTAHLTTERGQFSASGLSWRPGELTAMQPGAELPGLSVTAEAATVRWEDRPEVQASEFLQRLPDAVKPFLAGRSIREIEISRPIVDFEVRRQRQPEPVLEDADPRMESEAVEGALAAAIVRSFRSLAAGMDGIGMKLLRLPAWLPPGKLLIHGATVHSHDKGEVPGSPSLANLDVSVQTDPGRIEGRVRFECPEVAAGTNELRFTVEERKLSASLRASKLPLYPYQSLFPAAIQIGRNTVLRQAAMDTTFDGTARTLSVSGAFDLADATLHIPILTPSPMKNVQFAVSGTLDIDWGAGTLVLKDGRVETGRLGMPVRLSARSCLDAPALTVHASVERLAAQDLIESLPPEMIPALEGMRLAGHFAAVLDLDIDTRNLSALKFDFQPDVADLTVLEFGKGVNLDVLTHQFFHRIEEGGGKVVSRTVGPQSPSWVPLADVPRAFVDALTTCEDSEFFSHHGFSVSGIRRSLKVNLERGGFFQGASTLSQQLVKNLFLTREKTVSRKLQEVFITWQLERFLSKEKILELYLNVIEWGPEVYGLREAAMHYFGRKPQELDLLESAYLASIVPNPIRFHKFFEEGRVPEAFEARVKSVIREMGRRKLVSEESVLAALGRRITFAGTAGQGPANPKPGQEEPIPDDEFSE